MSNLKQITKKAVGKVSKYWFYLGRWHNQPCAFIGFDSPMCGCNYAKNKKEVVQAIEEAVREALEKTKLEKLDAERNTIYTWNEAVREMDKKREEFLK